CNDCLFTEGFATVVGQDGVFTARLTPTGAGTPAAGIHSLRAAGGLSGVEAFTTLYVSEVTGPSQAISGATTTAPSKVRGFGPRVNVDLASSPAGLFGPVQAATDDAGALDVPVALDPTAAPARYRVIATDLGAGFSTGWDVLLTTPGAPVVSLSPT